MIEYPVTGRRRPHGVPTRGGFTSSRAATTSSRAATVRERWHGAPTRGGFTLIEVLVVVAILALLVAVLLPSLAKAREQARTTVCATQLKEYGNATLMYNQDQRDRLPGPIHAAVELETRDKTAFNDYEEWHLPWFIRRYFSDRGRGGRYTDKVSACPTATRMASGTLIFTSGAADRPFTYAVNNFNRATMPYGTNPPWYFGYPNNFWTSTVPANQSPDPSKPHFRDAHPKRFSAIRQPSREWAIADAFCFEFDLPAPPATSDRRPGQWQIGTYQNRTWARRVGLPTKPYHSDGINVLCFDGHVEWQRPWRGTINQLP